MPASALLLWATALHAAEPAPPSFSLEVRWKGDDVVVGVIPPPGEHVAPEAPATLNADVAPWHLGWEGTGATLAGGLELAVDLETPAAFGAWVRLSLCTDAGTACRRADALFPRTRLEGRKGRVVIAPVPEGGLRGAPFLDAPDPGPALDAALAASSRDGRPVLLDFGAAWCPPCNRLAIEILHDPADAALVGRFHLLPVDADLPSSWTLKDRYRVGGYPTVIAVDAHGAEVSRIVGYPGEGQVGAWLLALSEGVLAGSLDERLAAFRAGGPVAPDRVGWFAVLVRDLARAGRADDARAVLAALPVGPERSIAALALGDGAADDVRRALAGDRGWVAQWMWDAEDLLDADPALRAEALPVLRAAAVGRDVPPADAADVFALLAGTAPSEEEGRDLWAASAVLIRASLVGDMTKDRAHWTNLADALDGAGDLDGAVAVLEEGRGAFPGEFTFHHALARLYLGHQRPADAEAPARDALRTALGDQRLRAAMDVAEALADLGRREEAVGVLDDALAGTPRPDPEVQVRTHRYVEESEEMRSRLVPGGRR